ncbi:MAG TPA: DUF4331 domain-containing protein [Polyangiaceae bacterium]|nr:DUF4331 domain-containing protein [Polyangiaceae bacterium]
MKPHTFANQTGSLRRSFRGFGKQAARASLAASIVLVTGAAAASSHREAPSISTDPSADNTDLYAWVCDQDGARSLCIVANYNPLELPEGGPNYAKWSDDVLYQVHLTYNDDKGKPSLADYMTIDVKFTTATTPRVRVDDKTKGPGGGKEFFAQLAGEFDQTADVTLRRADGRSENLFRRVKAAPPNIGQRTSTFVYGNPSYEAFAKTFIVSNGQGYRFFAGPRDDAFYVNLAQAFDLGAFVGLNTLNGQPFRSRVYDVDPNVNGTFANTDPTKAPDGVAGLNVHTIALAIPLTKLAPKGKEAAFSDAIAAGKPSNATLFGVWASASRALVRVFCPVRVPGKNDGILNVGPWVQVSRQGLPLINEVVIGVQDKDRYNRTTPANDVNNFGAYFLNPILVRDVEAIGGYAQLGIDMVPDDFKYNRTDILDVINLNVVPSPGAHQVEIANGRTGDVLRVDVAIPSAFPNGRPLSGPAVASGKEEDVTDVELSLILAKLTLPVSDFVGGPGDGRKLMPTFPYLGTPFAGDSEGKGRPAAF